LEGEVFMDENRNLDDYSVSETKGRGVPTGLILLLIGVGIGSLLAATLTPKTGKQLRKGLRRRYEDARDRLEEWSDQAEGWMQRGSELASAASSKVAPITRKFKREIG
jgi:gas vesicle protein